MVLDSSNRDNAIFADLIHCLSNDVADRRITICRNGSDLCDSITLNRFAKRLISSVARSTALSMPRFEGHRVSARGNCLHAFAEDSLSEHGRRSRFRHRLHRRFWKLLREPSVRPCFPGYP